MLGAMAVLICFSAFFSASEAALFSLRTPDLAHLKSGNRAQRMAVQLLSDPDRLLSAVLFWNLVVNIVYFALASLIGIRLQSRSDVGNSGLLAFTFGSLLSIIFLSEMLPKTMAVLKSRALAPVLSLPLAVFVRTADPLMPTLRVVNLLSRRLIWPGFRPEPYLDVTDLERAIELSTSDAELVDQERSVLRNLVMLSDLRVDECMRPRAELVTFRPPVNWTNVTQQLPPSGYLFVTEGESDEIVSAVELRSLFDPRSEHLEYLAQPVAYAPWCAIAADVMQQMETDDHDVTAVVNELGETIGVLTRRDLLDVVFTARSSRSERILQREPISQIDTDLWQVTGMTNLRTLEEFFGIDLPESTSVTVAGVIQESLQRLPVTGDHCQWGPFAFDVVDTAKSRYLLANVKRIDQREHKS